MFCPKNFTIKCCGRTYSTADYDTNIYITVFKNNPTKNTYKGQKIWREYTVKLDCQSKNNCQVAEVYRYNDQFQRIQRFRVTDKNYEEHFKKIQNSKQQISLKVSLKEKPHFNRLDLRYNKPISEEKGQKAYVNGAGFDGYSKSNVIDRSDDNELIKEYSLNV